MKEYILKPIMTLKTLTPTPTPDKPAVARSVPPLQPLPTAVMDPAKPLLKLGLDVHLEFIMAVAQRDHASAQAPRKFIPDQLVAQVTKWVAEGLTVYCVQEDTMGVEPRLNCPDRSWCGAQTPGTSQGGDTGRAGSRDKLLAAHLREGGERNCFEKEGVSQLKGE